MHRRKCIVFSFEKCRKVSMTRYGSTSVLVTIILTRPGAGAVLLFLSNCIFKPTLNEQYYNKVIRLGSKSSSREVQNGLLEPFLGSGRKMAPESSREPQRAPESPRESQRATKSSTDCAELQIGPDRPVSQIAFR